MNDIAQSIGFEDLSNFSAFISKHGKQSPNKIRKSIEWKEKNKDYKIQQEEGK